MRSRVFSLGQGTEGGIFIWLLKLKIFLGCLKFLIFFFFFGGGGGGGGERWMLGSSLRMKNK